MLTGTVNIVKAVKDYFGNHPDGQTTFISEFKALTPQDRADLRDELIREGYDIEPLKG